MTDYTALIKGVRKMERKVYVQRELIEKIGWEYFEGLRPQDFRFAKEGYQPDGLFLSMNDNGDYYLSLDEYGEGAYVEV